MAFTGAPSGGVGLPGVTSSKLGPGPRMLRGPARGFGGGLHGPTVMRVGGSPFGSPWPNPQSNPNALGHAMPPTTEPQNHPPLVKLPGAPGAPAPATAPPGTVTAPQPSALDSTYYQALNDATLQANNRINQYNQQSGYAGTDLQNTLSQLNYQQGLQTQNTENAENARGGFALGHLGQSIGQLNHAYLDRQSQDQLSYQRGQAARDAAVAAVRQGLSLEQAALAAAAADRASAAAARNPALGQSSAPLTGAPGGQPGTEGAPLAHPGAPRSQGGARQPATHHSAPSSEPRYGLPPMKGQRPTGGVGLPSGTRNRSTGYSKGRG